MTFTSKAQEPTVATEA